MHERDKRRRGRERERERERIEDIKESKCVQKCRYVTYCLVRKSMRG